MASKAELIASLRGQMEAIARGEADGSSFAGETSGEEAASRASGRLGGTDEAQRRLSRRPLGGSGRRGPAGGSSQDGEDEAGERDGEEPELTAERAFQKILRLAAAREQSTVRLRARLARDGYEAEVAEEAIARAVRVHAVDDRRYAEALVRMRVASGKGVDGVLAEIEELGLDPEGLDALAEYRAAGEDADVERALALLERRPPRAKNQRDAAFRKLVQQGFGSSTAATAARRWAESREA